MDEDLISLVSNADSSEMGVANADGNIPEMDGLEQRDSDIDVLIVNI